MTKRLQRSTRLRAFFLVLFWMRHWGSGGWNCSWFFHLLVAIQFLHEISVIFFPFSLHLTTSFWETVHISFCARWNGKQPPKRSGCERERKMKNYHYIAIHPSTFPCHNHLSHALLHIFYSDFATLALRLCHPSWVSMATTWPFSTPHAALYRLVILWRLTVARRFCSSKSHIGKIHSNIFGSVFIGRRKAHISKPQECVWGYELLL